MKAVFNLGRQMKPTIYLTDSKEIADYQAVSLQKSRGILNVAEFPISVNELKVEEPPVEK